jgi:hypothetical protein
MSESGFVRYCTFLSHAEINSQPKMITKQNINGENVLSKILNKSKYYGLYVCAV